MNIEKEFKELLNKLETIQESPLDLIKETYELQEQLLNCLINIEEKIIHNKEVIIANKNEIKKSDYKEFKISKNEENNEIKNENEFLKKELKRFREIGDSIAFLYFNKRDLKSLCWKQDSGYISGKKGLVKELEVFHDYCSKGMICILNDITNCLRFGDITIGINGKPQLIEVKTNIYDNPRVKRQAENLSQRNYLLNNDYVKDFPNKNETLKKISVPGEKNYINEFQTTLLRINEKDEIYIEPEKGIFYFFNYKNNKHEHFSKISKTCRNPKVYFLNAFKNIEENYLPFPILFNNNFYLNEFYKGNLLLVVLLDFDIFLSKLKKYQIILESEDDNFYYFSFPRESERQEIRMSKLAFTRIARELESMDWTIKCLLKAIENSN